MSSEKVKAAKKAGANAEKPDFEEAYRRLQDIADKMKSGDTKLEDAIAYYKEGMKQYEICRSILEDARQQIVTYRSRDGGGDDADI